MKNLKISKNGYQIFAEVLKINPGYMTLRYYVSDKGIPMDIEMPVTNKNNYLSKGDNVELQLLMVKNINE